MSDKIKPGKHFVHFDRGDSCFTVSVNCTNEELEPDEVWHWFEVARFYFAPICEERPQATYADAKRRAYMLCVLLNNEQESKPQAGDEAPDYMVNVLIYGMDGGLGYKVKFAKTHEQATFNMNELRAFSDGMQRASDMLEKDCYAVIYNGVISFADVMGGHLRDTALQVLSESAFNTVAPAIRRFVEYHIEQHRKGVYNECRDNQE